MIKLAKMTQNITEKYAKKRANMQSNLWRPMYDAERKHYIACEAANKAYKEMQGEIG